MRDALELAQVDPSVQEILLLWLSQVRYIFRHKSHEKDIWPSWGLRQGCTGSPVLWAAFTALLTKAIDHRTRSGWSQEHATLYADDSHLKWTFTTTAEFDRALTELRCVFAVFRRLGMKVNNAKTQAVLSVTGPIKHKIHKLYVREHGQERRLLLSSGDPSQWILLVDQAEYLGLIISYNHFEKQSVKHRISKANHRRWALASILHTKQMCIAYKLQLWRSCVLSTMMYALHCLHLSPGNIHLLQKTIMRHTRAIVSDQAFITGITHDEIMHKYQIRSACSILEQAHGRELALEQYEDWMIDVTWNQVISDGLRVAAQHTEPESDAEQEVWACPVCDEQFSNIAALKIHARRAHKLADKPTRLFDRTKHALHGLPQCAGCLRKFSRWQTLEAHVNNNSCPAEYRMYVSPRRLHLMSVKRVLRKQHVQSRHNLTLQNHHPSTQ